MSTRKTIQLIFKNEEGRNVTISLDNPTEPVDPQQIAAVMAQVIEEGAFITSGGYLVSKYGARIVERTIENIDVPF